MTHVNQQIRAINNKQCKKGNSCNKSRTEWNIINWQNRQKCNSGKVICKLICNLQYLNFSVMINNKNDSTTCTQHKNFHLRIMSSFIIIIIIIIIKSYYHHASVSNTKKSGNSCCPRFVINNTSPFEIWFSKLNRSKLRCQVIIKHDCP